MKEDRLQTETLARIFLEQGDPKGAAEIFAGVLQRDPQNAAAADGLSRCRALLGEGEKTMRERRLAVLRLLLARLRGEPVAPAPLAAAVDPRQRRRLVLQNLLEKIRAWRTQTAGEETTGRR